VRIRVKICGMTRPEDASVAARLGVDAIGLVFYPRSPRAVGIPLARQIARSMPPFVSVVALFVDERPDAIRAVLESVPVDLLQFHGDETNEECAVFGRPFIKMIAMRDGVDLASRMDGYPDAAGFLLDAYQPQTRGGGGRVFDWDQVPADLDRPIILAGGLTPENVADAVRRVRPYAVDVSSGVEQCKGIKSADRMAAFLRGVRRCDTGQDRETF
jgi:phosphoribosylanthranilate isomerase